VLDGELYTHEYKDDFNKICSLVKKTKPSASDIAETASKVEFWWYDIFTDDGKNTQRFSQRFDLIRELCETFGYGGWPIVAVPTATVNTREELDELYGQYLDDGYEGQMVRLDEPYENKRSASLLKRKTFSDDEYKIIEICEGNGNKSGMAGYAIMEREDGVRFRSNIKGNHEFLKDLLVQRDRYSGKYGTVKYFNLTPDGIPRFPYLIRMREGVSTD
jgi:DNA ligase-1